MVHTCYDKAKYIAPMVRSTQSTVSKTTMASVQSNTALTHTMIKVLYLLVVLQFSILIHLMVSSS